MADETQQPEKPREERERQLHPDFAAPALEFVNSPLWREFKRVLIVRRPQGPDPLEAVHTQAARGFQVQAILDVIELIDRLPLEMAQVTPSLGDLMPKELLDPKD